MSLRISAAIERWPVAGQFIISRGAKTYVDVLVAAASDGTHVGLGEATAIYYHGESAESCLTQIEDLIDTLVPMDVREARDAVQTLLPPGACLLYTSAAAAERSSVDLGGRRIYKKKKKKTHTYK
mgnify:CR=1 FL=1